MLQQLLADHRSVVFSEDQSANGTGTRPALTAAGHLNGDQEGVHLNWLIELVNSQVLLKGCETRGYIIISAAQAKILQRLHPPVWRDRSLVSKTSWTCSLDGMQYFATISATLAEGSGTGGAGKASKTAETDNRLDENILWLSTEHIGGRPADDESPPAAGLELPDMVGSGQSVGGVISETVGGCGGPGGGSGGPDGQPYCYNGPLQLQRIVSRCSCELVYLSYGQNTLDALDAEQLTDDSGMSGGAAGGVGALLMDQLAMIPPPPSDDVMDLYAQREQAVDSFALTHHDLNICTNSAQYEMLLDVINNLLLYVEPHRKEASERLQRLRFQLQLVSNAEDQRRAVQQKQNRLRFLVSQLRRLEKDTFQLSRALAEQSGDALLAAEFEAHERKV